MADDLDSAPDLPSGGRKRAEPVERKPRGSRNRKPKPDRKPLGDEVLDADTQPDPNAKKEKTPTRFTVKQAAEGTIKTVGNIYGLRGRECCSRIYTQQATPISIAVEEVAKDNEWVAQTVMKGSFLKWVMLMVTLEPVVAHHAQDHWQPALQRRKEAREQAQHGYFDQDQDVVMPEPGPETENGADAGTLRRQATVDPF